MKTPEGGGDGGRVAVLLEWLVLVIRLTRTDIDTQFTDNKRKIQIPFNLPNK